MLGFANGQLARGFDEFTSQVHPDDIAPMQMAVTAYLSGAAPGYGIHLRIRHKDGH